MLDLWPGRPVGSLRGRPTPSPDLELTLAQAALVRREWSEAAGRYSAAARLGARYGWPRSLAVYAHCRAGEFAEVEALRRDLFDDETDREIERDAKRHPGPKDIDTKTQVIVSN